MKVKLSILKILPSGSNKRKKLSNYVLLSSLLTVKLKQIWENDKWMYFRVLRV